ncbi:hypothetical protein ACVIGB_000691 [Bradyrhizobium sp. USDA 4341]
MSELENDVAFLRRDRDSWKSLADSANKRADGLAAQLKAIQCARDGTETPFKVLEQPFGIYLSINEIGDKNGHVCTAENGEIAKDILVALNIASAAPVQAAALHDTIMGAAKLHTHDHATASKIARDVLAALSPPVALPVQVKATDADLIARCQELLDWNVSSLLHGGTGGKVRELADTLHRLKDIPKDQALTLAAINTRDEAMREVVRLATGKAVGVP